MSNSPFDPFFSSDSPSQSSNNSTAASQLPGFGTTYHPSTQSQQYPPQNLFSGCYRPQLPNQEYQYNQYHQQQQMWNQQFTQQHFTPQPFPPQPIPPQQTFPPQPIPQFSTQPTSSSQPPEASSSKKTKKTKPKKTASEKGSRLQWSESESLSLAKCWMHVSEDPFVSTNQDKESFWYKIMALFNNEWSHTNRTKDSLSGKWELIRTKVLKFNGIYSQLVQSNGGRASGTSDSDILTAAIAEYKMTYFNDFPHLECWNFLKDKQKFFNPDPCVIGRRNKKRDAGLTREAPLHLDDDEDEDDNAATTFHAQEDRIPRPPARPVKSQRTTSSSATGSGNSAASSFFGDISEKVDDWSKMQSEKLAKKMEDSLEVKRVQRRKMRNLDMEFMRTDESGLPEEMREMIQQQKAEIMNKFRTGYYDIP